jgi:hypothetical protein
MVPATSFTDAYPRPSACLRGLQEAQGIRIRDKRDPEFDDALRNLALDGSGVEAVCGRVPDLDRLAALMWHLTVPSPRPSPKGGGARRGQRKRSK